MLSVRASPADHPLDDPGDPMRDIAAEKDAVTAGAAVLRHEAIQSRYAGGPPPDTAFRCASLLDVLQLKWVDLDEETRAGVLEVCETINRTTPPGTSLRPRPRGTPG